MSEPARLAVHTIGDVTVVEFLERLIWEMVQVEEIGDELTALVEKKGCRRVILDFTGVEMISSSTLGVLIRLKHSLDETQGRLVIAGLREELMRIFKITRLEQQFEFSADREAALALF
jgi:anti-anti-sigma factor